MEDFVVDLRGGPQLKRHWRHFLTLTFIAVLSIFFVLPFSAALAQTEPVAVFLTKQYEKPKGSPVTYTDTFEAAYAAGSYTLWVQSGENGLQEVKNVSVALNGVEIITSRELRASNPAMKVISVQSINTLTVTLKGQGGNHITVKVLCNSCPPINVQIDSPADGAGINLPYVAVKGTVTSTMETGVVVNGIMAQVTENQFMANHVPIDQGLNTITAVATASYGGKAKTSIQVYGQPTAQNITLTSTTESGLGPLEVTLKADTNLNNPVASSSLVHNGPSAPTITTISPTEYKALMTAPGLYTYTLVITDNKGHIYEDTIGISVFSKEDVDALLKGKWDGMKGSLVQRSTNNALSYFANDSRKEYQEIFELLSFQLVPLVAGMREISMVGMSGNVAEYYIRRTQREMDISYFIYFVKDENGIWKIRDF